LFLQLVESPRVSFSESQETVVGRVRVDAGRTGDAHGWAVIKGDDPTTIRNVCAMLQQRSVVIVIQMISLAVALDIRWLVATPCRMQIIATVQVVDRVQRLRRTVMTRSTLSRFGRTTDLRAPSVAVAQGSMV
jgi:hypothetical protein